MWAACASEDETEVEGAGGKLSSLLALEMLPPWQPLTPSPSPVPCPGSERLDTGCMLTSPCSHRPRPLDQLLASGLAWPADVPNPS